MRSPDHPTRRLTREEYLVLERSSVDAKSELHDGALVAMVGATRAHNVIVWNIGAMLHARLGGRRCEAYQGDMRVRVPGTRSYTYPDVAVVCGEPRFEDGEFDTLLNPTVLVEVLSPSTQDFDHGQKFTWYRRIEGLREYVLVAQAERRVVCFTRQDTGFWVLRELTDPDETVELRSIDVTLPLRDIYHRVEFPPSPDEETADQEPSP